MKIDVAIKKAIASGKAIQLEKSNERITLLPTNTSAHIIESVNQGEHLVYWQPNFQDLVADNWTVTSDFRIHSLPHKSEGPEGVPAIDPRDITRAKQLAKEWYSTK